MLNATQVHTTGAQGHSDEARAVTVNAQKLRAHQKLHAKLEGLKAAKSRLNVVPASSSQMLSEDTDDLDGSQVSSLSAPARARN
eukprot:1391947-Rhodomonas_salina.2